MTIYLYGVLRPTGNPTSEHSTENKRFSSLVERDLNKRDVMKLNAPSGRTRDGAFRAQPCMISCSLLVHACPEILKTI